MPSQHSDEWYRNKAHTRFEDEGVGISLVPCSLLIDASASWRQWCEKWQAPSSVRQEIVGRPLIHTLL
jgi:hypothetical protein